MDKDLKLALFIALAIFSGFMVSRFLHYVLRRFLNHSRENRDFDVTSYNFIRNAISFITFIITLTVIFYLIPGLDRIGKTLLASAGILAAAVGFASQQAFSNIISGIFLVMFKPFRVGDFIKIDEQHYGTVEDITLRHTVIRNVENRRVIIPNSVIGSQTITNSNILDPKVCSLVEIGISYSSDIDKAMDLISDEAIKHPFCIDNRTTEQKEAGAPQVVVRVIALADFSVNLRGYVWAGNNTEAFIMKTDLLKSIKQRFDREGIEIPFPYRTVILRNQDSQGS